MNFDPKCRFERNADSFGVEQDGGLLLLALETGRYIHLNATAHAIWQMLAAPCSFDALCAGLQARFAVDATRCRSEVSALLTRLVDARLVFVRACEPGL